MRFGKAFVTKAQDRAVDKMAIHIFFSIFYAKTLWVPIRSALARHF